jgi:acyl carrier protein
MNQEQVIQWIYAVIDETNEQLDHKQRLTKTPDTVLFGEGGKLDSLGLINFIVGLEQKVQDQARIEITLADQMLNASQDTPLHTVEALAAHIVSLVKE